MPKNSAMLAPIEYDYGDAFNYARWTEQTQLTMVNVPWNSDYRDVVRFANQGALDNWIDKAPHRVIDKMSLLKWKQNPRINLPLNVAMQYNYARASNPLMPVAGDRQQNYYYFVLDYIYINPNTTELVVQLDAWQTFGYKTVFGQCYVERGHIGIANSNQFNDYGRDYLTVPEGMDIGGEYRTAHVESLPIVSPSDPQGFSILVCSTTELSAPYGTVAQPYLYTAFGSIIQGLPSGASFYVFETPNDFIKFMKIAADAPWVTQGIISVTVIPHVTRYHPTWTPGTNLAPNDIAYRPAGTTADGADISNPNGTSFYAPPATGPAPHTVHNMYAWRNADFITAILGQYSVLKKFLTYPYTVIELTTFTGSPVILKPESWQDPDATVNEQASLVPPGQRIVIYPKNYNSDPEAVSSAVATNFSYDDLGDFINTAVALDNFPQMPVVNNMAISFLASNKNGIAFAYSNAAWDQQKALHGAQATYDVAGAEIQNRYRQAQINNRSAEDIIQMQNTNYLNKMVTNAGVAAVSNTIGVGSEGVNPIGSATKDAGAMLNSGFDMANQTAISNRTQQTRGEAAQSSNRAATEVRDTNVGLARFSAKGDYANAVAAENAKVQDAKMTQPSTSGQFGGDAFNLINGLFGYSLRFKMLNANAMKKIGDYWLRYGYAIGQFIQFPSSYMVMSKFTYWKLSESYIVSAPIPEQFKQTIRGIFEKGVTVWANPDYIGTTSLSDNTPLTGVSY